MLSPKEKYTLTAQCGKCGYKESKSIEVEPENLENSRLQLIKEVANRHKQHPDLNHWIVTPKPNMTCQCPLDKRTFASIGTLFLHLINSTDKMHEEWLDQYCASNEVDLGSILINRAKDIKGANKPLIDILKRDFCK